MTNLTPWLELPRIIALSRCDRKAMESYQERQLLRLVSDLFSGNEFYRRLWDEAGFNLKQFRGSQDMAMIPLVTKLQMRELRQSHPEKLPGGSRLIRHKTSGTSGEPLEVIRTWHEERFLTVVFKWTLIGLGFLPTYRMAKIRIPPEFEWLSDRPLRVLNKLGIYRNRVFSCFDEPEVTWKLMSEYRPDVITGYSESVARVARYGLDAGLSDVRPKVIGVGGERCTPLMRRQISEAFQAPVHQAYASAEVNLIAWECPKSNLLHLCDPTVLVEVLDKEGRPVAEGRAGQAVVTALHSRTMPFVRYDLGDQVVKGPAPCTCGAPYGTLVSVDGRKIDMLQLVNGKSLHAFVLLDEILEGDTSWIRQFQLIQDEPEVIKLRAASLRRPNQAVLEDLTDRLERFTAGTAVRIELVDEMELDQSGKFHLCKCNL